MSSNKFIKGVLYGALVGGVVTLFDRETRTEMVRKGKEVCGNVKEVVMNPRMTIHNVQTKIDDIRQTFQELNEDIEFIVDKAAELKTLGTETTKIIAETKEVFEKEEDKSGR